jgi:NADH-quinone oxidoreductase subunit N
MLDQILNSLHHFKPEATLAVAFCVVIVADLFFRRKSQWIVFFPLAAFAVTGVFLFQQVGVSESIFSHMFAVDSFSLFFKFVILLSSMLIVFFSMGSSELNAGPRRLGEYYALIVSLTLGMFLMAGSTNLLMMYMSIELASISSYILSGYTKEAPDSSEASLKYVIYGALSSGLMLYGISILYGLTGATDIYGVNRALMMGEVGTLPLLIAGILTVAGFGYKITAVPFHFWSPDVYEGAPITITALLAVASKAAGFAIMIRFFAVTFLDPTATNLSVGSWASFQGFDWNILLAIISVATMTLGNLVAIWQSNLKRLLAYSSIAHAGYILMGVVVLSNEGISAVLIYFVAYLFMNLGAFYTVMIVANKTGSEDIDAYKGLGYRSPFVAACFTIFLFSLTGIPPTVGFIGKLYLFAALISAKWIWLAIVGVLNSVVSLYYYVRIIRNMYLTSPQGEAAPIRFAPQYIALMLVLVVPNILLGLYFSPLVNLAQASVSMFGFR